jgi:glycerophosphoryl diester phosphodiesterase
VAVPLATSVAPAAAEPGDVVFSEDFDDVADGALPDGWNPVVGDWSVQDGRLVAQPTSIGRITFGPHLENYRFEATVRFEQVNNASRWLAPILDIDPSGTVPWWQAAMRSATTAGNGIELAERTAANAWSVPYTAAGPADAGVGNDVRIAIEVQGNRATWIYEGTEVLEGRIGRSENGVLGFSYDGARISVDDVVVTEIEPASPVNEDGELPVTAAHRGYSSVTPENTLAAYAAGMRTGAEYVEIDVHTTADGVPVVMHDQTVNRTTDGVGDVARLQSSYVTGLDAGSWFNPAFAGQQAPTFAEMLDLMGTGSSDMLLEVKGPETREEVHRIVDMVVEAGLDDRVVLQSFDENVLRYAYERAPQIPLGLLRGALDADPVATARALHATYYNPSGGALATRPSVVEDLNAAGIGVFVWTINSANDWARFAELGVEGVITDRPGAFIGWKAAQEQIVEPEPEPAPGLLASLAELELTTGQAQQLFSALGEQDWERLTTVIEKHVTDAELRERLLAEVAELSA